MAPQFFFGNKTCFILPNVCIKVSQCQKIAHRDTSKDADISTVGPCKEGTYENMVVATASVTDDACCFLADNVIGIVLDMW